MATLGWIALAVNLHFAGAAEPVPPPVEHEYTLSARVRPLLFWIRRDNVGAGRIRWTKDARGTNIELLIGSDPDRVPMRINRWGYIGEFVRHGEAEILGVMTETGEATVEYAQRNLDQRGTTHVYRAMRTRIHNGASITTLFSLSFPETVTYRAVDQVRENVTAGDGAPRKVSVPDNADYGFLNSVAKLVDTTVARHRTGTPPGRLKRQCIYANTLYEVRTESTTAAQGILQSEFAVWNRTTGKTTRFQMTYGSEGQLAGVPLRITFRPNWWFEAELNLDATPR